MKTEAVPTIDDAAFAKPGNRSKPLSFHPLKTADALAALLKVKPPSKTK
jgi:hypothetical protein